MLGKSSNDMSISIKVIKNGQDHEEALKLLEQLVLANPQPNTEGAEQIEVLIALIQSYESHEFPETLPDPIDAIQFRMEQQELKPVDLVPYIGSRSKVSEILSRKRPLTLSMIRALESGLGIPAKVLVQEADQFRSQEDIEWGRFPIKEMNRRGYFGKPLPVKANLIEALKAFMKSAGPVEPVLALLRKTSYRSVRPVDKHALLAWTAFVTKKAKEMKPTPYKQGVVNLNLMQKVAQLSRENDGPILAQDFLKKYGIALVIEFHFPQTYLDGATLLANQKHPIIGLTLRHDRLDNFWFTLMHELAHLALHSDQGCSIFYDDLDAPDSSDCEREADAMAGEALVPKSKWEKSPAKLIPSRLAAESLAHELGVHIAVVAGKMRYEGNNYAYLNSIIKEATVRKYFHH